MWIRHSLQVNLQKNLGKENGDIAVGKCMNIGKYSQEFQEKIKKNTNKMIDHSTAGAKSVKN